MRVLFRGNDGGFELSVQDNGRGLSLNDEDASFTRDEGLGFHIIGTSAAQLGGEVTVHSGCPGDIRPQIDGTRVTISFPLRARTEHYA